MKHNNLWVFFILRPPPNGNLLKLIFINSIYYFFLLFLMQKWLKDWYNFLIFLPFLGHYCEPKHFSYFEKVFLHWTTGFIDPYVDKNLSYLLCSIGGSFQPFPQIWLKITDNLGLFYSLGRFREWSPFIYWM